MPDLANTRAEIRKLIEEAKRLEKLHRPDCNESVYWTGRMDGLAEGLAALEKYENSPGRQDPELSDLLEEDEEPVLDDAAALAFAKALRAARGEANPYPPPEKQDAEP